MLPALSQVSEAYHGLGTLCALIQGLACCAASDQRCVEVAAADNAARATKCSLQPKVCIKIWGLFEGNRDQQAEDRTDTCN